MTWDSQYFDLFQAIFWPVPAIFQPVPVPELSRTKFWISVPVPLTIVSRDSCPVPGRLLSRPFSLHCLNMLLERKCNRENASVGGNVEKYGIGFIIFRLRPLEYIFSPRRYMSEPIDKVKLGYNETLFNMLCVFYELERFGVDFLITFQILL